MQKRNFILLIIVLVAIVFGTFAVFYFTGTPSKTTGPSASGGTNFFTNLFSFGKKTTPTENTTDTPADISGYVAPVRDIVPSNLKKISSMPIAGFAVFMKERFKDVPDVTPTPTPTVTTSTDTSIGGTATTGTSTKTSKDKKKTTTIKPVAPPTEFVPTLRYVEKATGNIYQTFAEQIDERKFTTTVIPKVYEAVFSKNADSVVMRYLKEKGGMIETFVGALPKQILGADSMSSTEMTGSFLPENITDLSMSYDGSKMFYLFNYTNNAVGISAGPIGEQKTQIFNSPFTGWLSSYPNPSLVTLTTKPSSAMPGFMYAVDSNRKTYKKILGDINGLTTLTSPNGNLVLYSDNTLALHLYHLDTGNTDTLGAKTMPEKCTWNKTSTMIYCAVPKSIDSGDYPDTWYQGEVSFSDEIWKIDATTGNATAIADPTASEGGEAIDGTKLAVDDSENYLFFVNKKDSYLWELKLQ